MPEGFARATGVIEEDRKCQECKRSFRATASTHDKTCPHCGSPATVPQGSNAVAGAAPSTVGSPSRATSGYLRITE